MFFEIWIMHRVHIDLLYDIFAPYVKIQENLLFH